ncbi:MAG: hypothetical protein CVV32_11330 [Methanomicrobiales archaeon HGW-Methanomicrobiales-3]|jgi:hypothetical protein|nr:MAG: hypothetical protein CVV32_11330 [Methanomicrobiales archaeon HGW-Methanomicrobiales-3]
MGSVHDIMQTFAGRDLHARFSEYDGWVWRELPPAKNGDVMFRVTRGNYYHQEEAIVAVSFDIQPSHDIIKDLRAAPAGRGALRYLLVPHNADLPDLAEGITPLWMAAFGVIDGKLTWLTRKNRAVRYAEEGLPHTTAGGSGIPAPAAAHQETPASSFR